MCCGPISLDRELLKNDHYITSWKKGNSKIFSGFYKNFPMIRVYEKNKQLECVAISLQDWQGLQIRPEVLEQDIYGEITIKENANKTKCNINCELFWELNSDELPEQKIFSLDVKSEEEHSQSPSKRLI